MSESTSTPAAEPAQFDAGTASDTEFQAALDQIEGGAEPSAGSEPQQAEVPAAAPKMVPLSALHEARNETRKEREARLTFEATMTERMNRIQASLAQPKEPPAPAPEFEADPAAYLKHEIDQLKPAIQQTQQERQQAQAAQQFQGAYHSAAQQFAAETPDFGPAYQHAIQHMQALEQATGIPATAMEQEIALTALRQGRNPAQAVYAFAKANGYAPKAAEPALAAQQRGQAATRSVGQAGAPGGASNTAVQDLLRGDLKAIGDMSDADFERVLATIR